MPFQPGKPRSSSVLASVLAAAGIVLTVASCRGHLTPLGPDAAPQPRHLGSPIVLQAMRAQPITPAGGCPAGYVTLSAPGNAGPGLCYRKLGTPVTITSAAVAGPLIAHPVAHPVAQPVGQPVGQPAPVQPASPPPGQPTSPPPGQPGQPAGTASYGLTVAVPVADVAAVTAVITQAYDSRGAVDISVAGKTWAIPQVIKPFPGRQFQIGSLSRNQFLQLQRILVPPG